MDLSIIILSYNTVQYLKKCLDSIYRYTSGIDFEILVVDNASSDGSPEMVERLYKNVILMRNSINLGFSMANNLAIRHARGRYIVLMNSDTELLNSALKNLVIFMDKHSEAGAVGPRTWSDPERTLLLCGARHFSPPLLIFKSTPLRIIIPHNKTFLQYWEEDFAMVLCDDFCEVDTIGGHCFMVRREVIEKCGMLDENFFFFFEDADWSLRIKTAGWRLYHLADAEIVHHLWKSSSNKEKISMYYRNSMDYFMRKHYRLKGTWTLKAFGFLEFIKRYIPFKSVTRSFLKSDKNLEQETTTVSKDFRITWKGNSAETGCCNIFQISYSPDFIPSGSKKVYSNSVEIPERFISGLPEGLYYWRVIPGENKYLSPIVEGCLLKKALQ